MNWATKDGSWLIVHGSLNLPRDSDSDGACYVTSRYVRRVIELRQNTGSVSRMRSLIVLV